MGTLSEFHLDIHTLLLKGNATVLKQEKATIEASKQKQEKEKKKERK